MIKAGQIAKGMFLLFKDEPYQVSEREFVNPGKGSAFVRLKLKNLRTGLVIRETVKSQDTVEDIVVENRDSQYLYQDSDYYHFMDSETYEQFTLPVAGLEEMKNYLREGDVYQVMVWEEKPIDIKIPLKMILTVTHAENAVRGDTVSGTTKVVTVETGLKVKVPIFIKEGERILVNTEAGEYVERVN
ncbi:MAG TPA: elongation factor P [Spirochaetia bacterium]|nr:elongation factor P [Spirochaetia bacterium]